MADDSSAWRKYGRRLSVSGASGSGSSKSGSVIHAGSPPVMPIGDNLLPSNFAHFRQLAAAAVAESTGGAVQIVASRNTLDGSEFVLTANSHEDAALSQALLAAVREKLRAPWSLAVQTENLPVVEGNVTLTEPRATLVLLRHPLALRRRAVAVSGCMLLCALVGLFACYLFLSIVLSG